MCSYGTEPNANVEGVQRIVFVFPFLLLKLNYLQGLAFSLTVMADEELHVGTAIVVNKPGHANDGLRGVVRFGPAVSCISKNFHPSFSPL